MFQNMARDICIIFTVLAVFGFALGFGLGWLIYA